MFNKIIAHLNYYKSINNLFWNDSTFFFIFVASLIVIVIKEGDKLKRCVMFWYPVIGAIFLFNPLTFKIITKFFPNDTNLYYVRFVLIFPFFVIISYAIVLLLKNLEGRKKYFAAMLIAMMLICFGNSLYMQDFISRSSNLEKVPQDVIQICDIIENDKGDRGKEVLALVPSAFSPYIRQIDTSIILVYGRVVESTELTNNMDVPEGDRIIICNHAISLQCKYLVVYKSEEARQAYNTIGFVNIGDSDNCMVFKIALD